MKLTAKEAQALMTHKDDIMFGVRERVYHQIQAGALTGNCGCTFTYPIEYDGYWETEMFIQELIDSGYEVVDKGVVELPFLGKSNHFYEVYWAV
jgi:hypothetical protein